MVHPDDRDRVLDINRKRQKGDPVPAKYVFKGIRRDNQTIFLETSSRRVQYRGENVSLVFLRDITDRVQAEAELKASGEKYRLVVEHANEAIFIAQDGVLKLINPKVLEITGYDRDTLRRLPFPELIHPEDRALVVERHQRRIGGESPPAVYSFRIVDRRGKTRWVEINTVRVDWEGRPATLNFLSDISERVEADRALRESEERARLIFDTVPDSITITRLSDGRYLQVNDYFCQLTGYSREETIGRTVADLNVFVRPRDREDFIREMREKGEVKDQEIQYRKKDGTLFTTLLSARPIHYGGEDSLVAVVTDITKRKMIEDALRQSEAQHRKLVEAMREGFGVVDERNMITYINKRFADLLGYRPEEMIGRPVADFVDPEYWNRLREQGERRRRGEAAPYEIAWRRRDGQGIHTLMSPEPVFDEQGGFKGSSAVITDISERKQMEEALKKSEERYRLLVENANEAILVIQGGLIRFVNPKAVAIMRWGNQELTPKPFLDFVHPEDRETVLRRYQERLTGQPLPSIYSFRLLDQEGNTIWVEINAVQVNWEGEPAALVFLTDITEKKQLELQFLQAQKMEAIGRLAGGVAHDFNNLLTSILGHADLMLLALRPGDPLVSDIREIKKAADRATDLTRQLLAFSRKQILQPKVLNLNQVIGDMKKMLRRMIGEDIELETNLAPDLGQVLVDPGQIDQVIMNLVINARDALPQGGKLAVTTQNAAITADEGRRYVGSKPGAYVLLVVQDDGLGMSAEVQSHIFEPFFTTKELGKGTGLGLSTVYGIVKQSNGYIWVESEPGRGTTFKIYLPRIEGRAASAIRPEKAPHSYQGTETILLVEDNDLVRQLAHSVLEQFGYRVLEARNGAEAHRLSRGYEGKIDLLLTDVVMPGMSGQALAERIREGRPTTEILFMSGYSEEVTLEQGSLAGGRRFLQKPFSPAELGQRVRELLDKRGAEETFA
jgi:PAS domain S-box-containing protein